MGHGMWTPEFEPTRRQRRRARTGSTAATGGRGPWGGPWGGPMGGPPPWVAQMFGPDLAGGPGGGWPRGRRVRRGDVRSAILDVLQRSEPINGYQVIQQIADRTDGRWKPSPGSVYPTIAQLEDEGLVEDAPSGRKALQLTDEGRRYVAEHPEEMEAVWAPFDEQAEDHEALSFKQVIGQTVGAIVQVMQTGTPDQREKTIEILADTRRRIYGLLADGPEDTDARTSGPEEGDGPAAHRGRRPGAAVGLLGEHYALGRLTKDEFDERSDAVWSARTRGDLAPVFDDLPVRSPAVPDRSAAPRRRAFAPRWGPLPLVPVLVLLLALMLMTQAPFLFFILLVWFLGGAAPLGASPAPGMWQLAYVGLTG